MRPFYTTLVKIFSLFKHHLQFKSYRLNFWGNDAQDIEHDAAIKKHGVLNNLRPVEKFPPTAGLQSLFLSRTHRADPVGLSFLLMNIQAGLIVQSSQTERSSSSSLHRLVRRQHRSVTHIMITYVKDRQTIIELTRICSELLRVRTSTRNL